MDYKVFNARLKSIGAGEIPMLLLWAKDVFVRGDALEICKTIYPNKHWFVVTPKKQILSGEIVFCDDCTMPPEFANDPDMQKPNGALFSEAGVDVINYDSLDIIAKTLCRFDECNDMEAYYNMPMVRGRHDIIMQFIRDNFAEFELAIRKAPEGNLDLILPPEMPQKRRNALIRDTEKMLRQVFPISEKFDSKWLDKAASMWRWICRNNNHLILARLYET